MISTGELNSRKSGMSMRLGREEHARDDDQEEQLREGEAELAEDIAQQHATQRPRGPWPGW